MALEDILQRQGRSSVNDPVDYTKVGDGNKLSRIMGKVGPKLAVGALTAMTGGALAPLAAGLLGAGTIGAGALTGAGAGAMGGGLSAGISGGDIGQGILKGGLFGAAGGGLSAGLGGLNAAGAMGIENSVGQGVVNGAIKGGATAALKGGDIGQGLLGGAVNGGVGGAWNAAGGLNGIGSAIGGAFDGDTAAMAGDQVSALGGSGMFDFGGGEYDWGNVDMFPDSGAGFDFGGQDMFGNFSAAPEIDYSQLTNSFDWGNTNFDGGTSSFGSGGLGGALGGLANKVLGGIGGSGNLAALIGAGLGATQGGKQQTATLQRQIDPRMAQYLYGTGYGDQNSFLGAAQKQFQANPSGINPMMQQGLDMQKAALTDPAYSRAYTDMRTQGTGLMNMQAAGNPFTQAGGMAQAGGAGGLLGDSSPDRIQSLMAKGRGLLGQ